MKKKLYSLTVLLTLLVIAGTASLAAHAKDLEPCNLCNATGKFHCSSCNNTGKVTCTGCGGKGGRVCPGDVARGHGCNNGYYTCTSCGGDGKNRTGDGKITEGVCGNCGGSGKLRCVVCSHDKPGWNTCEGCGGTGKQECMASNCKDSKAIGWLCPKCHGTGYILLGNPMPPPSSNDGVKNVPVAGDHIIVDNHTWQGYIYGGGNGTTTKVMTPQGGGQTTQQNTTAVTQATQSPTETTQQTQTTAESTTQSETTTQTQTSQKAEYDFIPGDRNGDFDLPAAGTDGKPSNCAVRVETGAMSESEKEKYMSLSDQELGEILDNVRKIAATAQPGHDGENNEQYLKKLAAKNGFDSLDDGRLVPLYFEGHQDIGFKVKVSVKFEKGVLNGGKDLYVYHITGDETAQLLGKADHITYDDGSIEELSFYTTGFSSFFTAAKELDTDISSQAEDNSGAVKKDSSADCSESEDSHSSTVMIVVICVGAAAVTAGVLAVVIRKKKTKTK